MQTPAPVAKPAGGEHKSPVETLPSEGGSAPEPCDGLSAITTDLPAVTGANGCGFTQAVELAGITRQPTIWFSSKPVVTCSFAKGLAAWISEDVSRLATAIMGQQLKRIHTGPGYQCRLRNNEATGKLSEHALGKALDIASFELASGEIISVDTHWNAEVSDTAKAARFLRAVHSAACDRFTTVLGPEADANHREHFHLDSGCHGKSCTYRICQ